MTTQTHPYALLLRVFLVNAFYLALAFSEVATVKAEPTYQYNARTAVLSYSDTPEPVPLPPPAVRFERLLMEDGLSSSSVTSIMQDNLGFIWIGTQGGLNKYDGLAFKVYIHDPDDPHSLRDNFIHTIYEDRDGILWIGTQDGWLERYDRAADHFDHYKIGVHALAMLEDSSRNFWIGTQDPGLVRFDRDSGETETVWPDRIFTSIAEDKTGNIWFGSREGWIARYAQGQEGFSEYEVERPIEDILVNDQGSVWAAAGDAGVGLYDSARDEFVFESLPGDKSASEPTAWVTSLNEGLDGDLWAGSSNGLYKLAHSISPVTTINPVAHYIHDPSDPHSLLSNQIVSVYEDLSGVLWIANSYAGISKLPAGAGRFGHYRHSDDSSTTLYNDSVTSITEDQDGGLWVGGFSGLDRWDSDHRRWINYQNDPQDASSLSDNAVRSLFVDATNNVWIGTEGGLDRYDRETDRFVRYDVPVVMWMLEDQAGAFWLATKGGLYQLDRESERITLVRKGRAWKIYLYEDRAGHIWVGTSGDGLERLDPETGEWSVYKYDLEEPSSLGHHSVNAISEDSSGTLWIATGDGLDRFEAQEERFTHFRQSDGLADGWIAGMLPDEHGDLWLSTGRGLSRFDPRTESFRNYGPSDGLQDYYYWRNAQFSSPSGMIYFGGVNGFNAFRPDRIVDNPQEPALVITALSVHDKVQQIDLPSDTNISLDHQDNFLSFDFAALDFGAPEMNEYAYQMEGLDDDWVQAGNRHHADYPDLKPGSYTFRVIGSYSDGVWNEEGASVSITIQPPFWQTWWFRGILLLGFLGVVYVAYRLRVRTLESRSRELEQQVESRTVELSEANLRLEQEMWERGRAQEALAQEQAKAAVTAERNRLARDLHDSVTQSLYSLTLFAEATRHEANEKGSKDIGRQVGQIGLITQQALKEMRLLVYELRPLELEKEGLIRALRRRIEAVEGRAGIEGRVIADEIDELPGEVEENFFRIAQEALNNTLKHASASSVTVSLRKEGDEIVLAIEDDGIGFDLERVRDQGGMGLVSIEERALEIGGTATIQSAPGVGTSVKVRIAMNPEMDDIARDDTDE
jgi:signal transduction histidine kinase/ligand-binding sensor domain-containing protein